MATSILPIDRFDEFSDRWNELNKAHDGHPLLEARFHRIALRTLGDGNERLAVVGAEDEPDAIAILSPGKLGTWSTFQPSQSPLGAMIIRRPDKLADIAAELMSALPVSCQILSVTQQDPDLAKRPDSESKVSTLDYIETARITLTGSFDDYWASRGKNLRHNMKRQRNRLEREGTRLRLEVLTKPEQMRDGISQYGELESLGWKAEGGTAIHPDNEQGRFYTELLEAYAQTGNAAIYQYYYDDQLSATDLCISNHSAMVILKTTYDESIKTSSPALLMRREYFPDIFDARETRRIEFYGKVMDWHTKWSDEIRRMYHLNAYRNRIVASLHGRD